MILPGLDAVRSAREIRAAGSRGVREGGEKASFMAE